MTHRSRFAAAFAAIALTIGAIAPLVTVPPAPPALSAPAIA